jgi:hypothetical protein
MLTLSPKHWLESGEGDIAWDSRLSKVVQCGSVCYRASGEQGRSLCRVFLSSRGGLVAGYSLSRRAAGIAFCKHVPDGHCCFEANSCEESRDRGAILVMSQCSAD